MNGIVREYLAVARHDLQGANRTLILLAKRLVQLASRGRTAGTEVNPRRDHRISFGTEMDARKQPICQAVMRLALGSLQGLCVVSTHLNAVAGD